jgi:hypothetical protein
MVTHLSKQEQDHFADLAANFDKHVEVYRKEKQRLLAAGKQAELEEQLKQLESYFKGASNNKIADLFINMEFCGAKINVLRVLLGKHELEKYKRQESQSPIVPGPF